MNDVELEGMLREFDFSKLSAVREPLLRKILVMRRFTKPQPENPWEKCIADEELDLAAAAGDVAAMEMPKHHSKDFRKEWEVK